MSTGLLFGSIWMAIGLIFLLIVRLIRHFSEKGDSRCTAQAWATVIDMREGTSQDSDGYEHTVYRPIYQFSAQWNETAVKILKLFRILGIVLLIAGAVVLAFPIWKNLLPIG